MDRWYIYVITDITDIAINVLLLLMFYVYMASIAHLHPSEGKPSSVVLIQPPSFSLNRLFRFFLSHFEGLRTQEVTTDCKAVWGNNVKSEKQIDEKPAEMKKWRVDGLFLRARVCVCREGGGVFFAQ